MGRNLEAYVLDNYQKAMDYHYIQAYYQPVIRTVSRKCCSVEALARWIDPEIGMIYPDEFIPVLENIHAIHLLDICILRQACMNIKQALNEGIVPIPISVNLSRLDFTLCDIFYEVDRIISEFELPHDFIYFEITESIMAEQKEMMLEIVDRFRSAGYQIWMDDFGSAYSALNVLKEISFDELKLDMVFLRPFNQRSKRIATSVIEMAKSIEIHTLAEGIETEEQFRYLRNIGCEKVQGYYFGKPMPYQEMLGHLKENNIEIELPQDRKYYDDIGKMDLLSAVPFMTKEERDELKTARQLNSIPLALIEVQGTRFSVLFYNSAFEQTTKGTDLFGLSFSQDILRKPIPFHSLSDKIVFLMDSTRQGMEGRMLYTSQENYYEIQARCIAKTSNRYTVMLRISNLSQAARTNNTEQLDEFLRRIYAIYERITLIDLIKDSLTTLYMTTRERLVSENTGIRKLAGEFADLYIYPDDREAFLSLADPKSIREWFDTHGRGSMTKLYRMSVNHGRFAWKAFTLLRVDEDKYLLLIQNLQQGIADYWNRMQTDRTSDARFTDGHLWRNLIHSDLIRIFWKDKNRCFLGASKAFLNYYNFDSVDDILGKTDEDLGWHIHPGPFMNDEWRIIRDGMTTHNIPGWCINDGENKEILASKTPMYDENGEISGLMGYFIDRELLDVNDKRGQETDRRDMLTGLLNSRGISEEAASFRDEYFLRNMDFVRAHVAIDEFASINEQYGFDFGDKVLASVGKALKSTFGHTCAVGRYAGHRFVILHQVQSREEAHDLRMRIKSVGQSIHELDGISVTVYLSVGYVLFSEYPDVEEQSKRAEIRLLADHNQIVSVESRLSRSTEIFHLFDDPPVPYCVFYVRETKEQSRGEIVVFYVNHAYEQFTGQNVKELMGHAIHVLYPKLEKSFYDHLKRAALDAEHVMGEVTILPDRERIRYRASQVICPGYCAVTFLMECS